MEKVEFLLPVLGGEYSEEYEFCLSGKATRLYQDKKGIPHFPPLKREYGEGQEEEKVFKRFLDLDGGVYTFDDFCREKLGGWRDGYDEADRRLNRIKKEEPYKLKDLKKRYDDLDSKVLQIDKDVKRDDPVLISVFKEVGWREFGWFGSSYPYFRVVWVQKGIPFKVEVCNYVKESADDKRPEQNGLYHVVKDQKYWVVHHDD
jgi:hypothetical protein